ncbi:hypothetical protein O181_007301 [Austropuccinia psidii MF-1]|uniref:Uncharacterized protein n=1 Tax=Austropuccinia psidii MF-1 TaxID=1389203 RepID=A0A9Q3BMJ2_9BASI|nr:hypothetical protein [Austropuccinia psidii MF-1]
MSTLTNSYPPIGPSRYASDAATQFLPSPILMLPQQPHVCPHPSLRFSTPTTYHSYDTATHPCASAPPPPTILMLPQDPQDMPPMLLSNVCPHQSLCFCPSATYHPYTPILDP